MRDQVTAPIFRLYIDEVGNSDIKASVDNDNHRYLSLTGVIITLEHIATIVHPELEGLKQTFFSSHPDEPIIFHRREMSRRLHPFSSLREPEVETAFNEYWLSCLNRWDYKVITVTIDKYELLNRYKVWRYHPYHYCLHVLLERYVMYLESLHSQGDVMAEARGRNEDKKLKDSFSRIHDQGTSYISMQRFKNSLTSKEIKLKEKPFNIAGLQIADSLAHPAFRHHLEVQQGQSQKGEFTAQIVDILRRNKFIREASSGKIEGWGMKWLP